MAIERVRDFFNSHGIADRILEFPVSSATVELAAQALGCEAKRIAKTLSFLIGESVVLVVAAGDARIDNAKFKVRFGVKPKMLDAEHVLAATGHEVGGVCPFVIPEGVPVYLDVSLQRFVTVFPACGSSNSAIELTLAELQTYALVTGWVDVCKNWD